MSFNIGLSGLYAANKQLDVTGNNIANVATTGFKSSRAEFEDVYSATKLGSGSKTIGNGVRLANVSQQFTQGDVNNTGNVTDVNAVDTLDLEALWVYGPLSVQSEAMAAHVNRKDMTGSLLHGEYV